MATALIDSNGASGAASDGSRRFSVSVKAVDHALRIVHGEVYAPCQLDSHGELMLPDDIELMAHRFMQLDLGAAIDTGHDNLPNGSYPVESFIAREGDPDYAAGAWVLGVKIPDDGVWAQVVAGELNAFSFEAYVRKESAVVEFDLVRDRTGLTHAAGDDGHAHFFLVQLSDDGKVRSGATSPGPDGHVHAITRASITGAAAGHTHRYAFL